MNKNENIVGKKVYRVSLPGHTPEMGRAECEGVVVGEENELFGSFYLIKWEGEETTDNVTKHTVKRASSFKEKGGVGVYYEDRKEVEQVKTETIRVNFDMTEVAGLIQ